MAETAADEAQAKEAEAEAEQQKASELAMKLKEQEARAAAAAQAASLARAAAAEAAKAEAAAAAQAAAVARAAAAKAAKAEASAKLASLRDADSVENVPVQSDAPAAKRGSFSVSSLGGGGARCAMCMKTVYCAEQLVIGTQTMHKECFRCCQCHKLLSSDYCLDSATQRFYCRAHFMQLPSRGGVSNGAPSGGTG
jgi:membrane protein involved in colicin uptake